MQSTTKEIDFNGRIVLPKKFRKALNLDFDDKVRVNLLNDRMEIIPVKHKCVICGNDKAEILYLDKYICTECVVNLKNIDSF